MHFCIIFKNIKISTLIRNTFLTSVAYGEAALPLTGR
jgi:hypothetical protein